MAFSSSASLFKLSIIFMIIIVDVCAAARARTTTTIPKGGASGLPTSSEKHMPETTTTTQVSARKDIPASGPSHRTHSTSLLTRHLLRTSVASRRRRTRGLRSSSQRHHSHRH
ncbi:hypothetical protein AAC387_Pa06g0864 [Persea americana]